MGGPKAPLEPYFIQFNAATPKLRGMTIRQRVGLVESSALRELRTRIRERQEQLNQLFAANDPEGLGKPGSPCNQPKYKAVITHACVSFE